MFSFSIDVHGGGGGGGVRGGGGGGVFLHGTGRNDGVEGTREGGGEGHEKGWWVSTSYIHIQCLPP